MVELATARVRAETAARTGPAAQRFQPAWATRAHLLALTGDRTAAHAAFTQAIALSPRRRLLSLHDRLPVPDRIRSADP